MTANFRENVTAIWRRNVWWPSSRPVPSSSRLVSFCPSGWKKETGHASRGHEGCCKTLRLNILDVFRPATPFHPSAHPFPYSLVAGVLTWKVLLSSTTTADRLRCAAKYSFFFFSFLFTRSRPCAHWWALSLSPSLSFVPRIGFLGSVFPPPVFFSGTLEPCPGGDPRLSPVSLLGLNASTSFHW